MAIMSVSAICSFCNKPSTDPSCEVMIAQQSLTGTVSICDACVKLCVDIVAEKRAEVRLEKRAAEEAARGCRAHFPIGEDGQFVWAGTQEKVGT